ncbi:MAG: hypothetical protein EXR96_08785 [Nitrospiraceae bacterium]|nr:hypothetical protein [Nitrospiraceae bacterium]
MNCSEFLVAHCIKTPVRKPRLSRRLPLPDDFLDELLQALKVGASTDLVGVVVIGAFDNASSLG